LAGYYKVTHERDGYIVVIADDAEDAVDKYYESIESMIGHQLRICGCFGEEKPLDRSKVLGIKKIEYIGKLYRRKW